MGLKGVVVQEIAPVDSVDLQQPLHNAHLPAKVPVEQCHKRATSVQTKQISLEALLLHHVLHTLDNLGITFFRSNIFYENIIHEKYCLIYIVISSRENNPA